MLNWLKKINPFGDSEAKVYKQYQPMVDSINQFESEYQTLTNEELSNKTNEFTARLNEGETLDDILPEAFATVREASRRTIGLRHYDVQLIGGVVLHQGRIAEMKTGEGKTLVATLPLYLNALAGKGSHLVTVNDYLARRDAGWMGPIYHLLGMSLGFIGHDFSALYDAEYVDPTGSLDDERLVHWRPCSRREAYEADITYGTNNEFGFDYLRDNMVHTFEQVVQRKHAFAIVDEVDNILIDEARTPLIISGPASKSSSEYARFAQVVSRLRAGRVTPDEAKKGATPDGDALIDPKTRSVILTDDGLLKVEAQIDELGENESIYDPQHTTMTHYLENALKAKFIFFRDKDYVVENGEVIIVDEFTGRLMPGRRWSDGLHQAVEAKEGVDVRRETTTYATITFQNYFRMYDKLAGMTGTAATEREEFGKIYNLEVTIVPTNKPCIREDAPDLIYRSEQAKFRAVTEAIKERVENGQPVLVGTTAVETSERLNTELQRELSDLIKNKQAQLYILNAKQNADEAAIIAQAGKPSVVTIATNMAGRGTDILLGGNPDALASRYIQDIGFEREELEVLAESLFDNQKKGSPQEIMEGSDGKLSEDLIAALQELHTQYEQDLHYMEEKGINLFLVDRLLSEVPQTFYEQKLELVRAILMGNQTRARKLVHDIEEINEGKITEIQYVVSNMQEYRKQHSHSSKFLAGKLFERVYTARARLVQLSLHGDIEAAREMSQNTPGLPEYYIDEIVRIQQECKENHEEIKESGGLFVIGTERHEARRIDNQLRGRAGRQGDMGFSRFFLSLEDDLMKRFGRMDMLKGVMEKMGVEDDMPIESNIVSKSIEGAQARVEGFNFDMRKHTVDYDDVMNIQREVIYERRQRILLEADEHHRIMKLLDRYFKPDQLLVETHDEVRLTTSLPEEKAIERVKRILTDVSFDIAELRAANDEQMVALLRPIIEEQQHASIPLLVDEIDDILDMPDDAEEYLSQATHEEAKQYLGDLWRDQREGDLEERIKELFSTEFQNLINRYLEDYDNTVRSLIRETITDATNPANEEVNISLVIRRLRSFLPDLEQQEEELSELSSAPDKLQRTIESQIAKTRDDGHNITLLIREFRMFLPFLPAVPEIIYNTAYAAREQEREKYIELYTKSLATITARLPEEEQERLHEEAAIFIREQIQSLQQDLIKKDDRNRIANAINELEHETLLDIFDQLSDEDISETMLDVLDESFERWRDVIGEDLLNNYQRSLMLQTIDREWQEYLTAMEDMRQGIGLQAIGQRDPLVQYKTTAFRMFNELQSNIDQTVVQSFFQQLPNYRRHLEEYQAELARREKAAREGYETMATGQGKTERKSSKGHTVRRDSPKIGPNDACPCGSGKKYKHCHGRADHGAGQQVARGRSVANMETVSVANSGDEMDTTMDSQAVSSQAATARGSGKQKGRSAPPPPAQAKSSSGSGSSSRKKKKKK